MLKKVFLASAVFFLSFFLLVVSAISTDITLSNVKDTWCYSSAPNTNFEGSDEIYTLRSSFGNMQSNFTDIADIPQDAIIDNAIYSAISGSSTDLGCPSTQLNISEITYGLLDYTAMTWNNFGQYNYFNASEITQNTTFSGSGSGYNVNFTVTDIVQKWVNERQNINGFWVGLSDYNHPTGYCTFWSAEKSTALKEKLYVTFHVPETTTTTSTTTSTTSTSTTTSTTSPPTTTTTIPLGFTGEILLASQPSNESVNTVPTPTALFQKIPNQLTTQNIKLTKISAYIVCFPSTNVGYGLVNGTNVYSDKIIYFNNKSVDTIDGYGSWVNFTLGSGVILKPLQNYTFFINSSSGCSGVNFMSFFGVSGCNDTSINNTCTKHGGTSAFVDEIGISDYTVSMGYKMYGFGLGNRCDAWQGLLLDRSQYLSCSLNPKCDKNNNYCDYYAVMSQQFCNETVVAIYKTVPNGVGEGGWCGAYFWPYCKTGLYCDYGICEPPNYVCSWGGILSENRKWCYMASNVSSTGCMALSGQTLGFTNIKCGVDYDYIQNYGYKTVKCSDFNCTYYKDQGFNVSFITYQPVVNKTKVNGHCVENGTYTYFIYDECSTGSTYSANKTDICKKSQVCVNDIGCIGNTTALTGIGELPEGTNPIFKAMFSQQGMIIILFSVALGIAYFFLEDEFILIIVYSIGNFLLGSFGISFFGILCSVLGLLAFFLTQHKTGGVQKSATS